VGALGIAWKVSAKNEPLPEEIESKLITTLKSAREKSNDGLAMNRRFHGETLDSSSHVIRTRIFSESIKRSAPFFRICFFDIIGVWESFLFNVLLGLQLGVQIKFHLASILASILLILENGKFHKSSTT